MEKRTFAEIHPQGLKRTVALFEKAFYRILSTDEIDKLINNLEAGFDDDEIDNLVKLKESFKEYKDEPWYSFNWIPVMDSIDSPILFRDIITYMALLDNSENYTE